MRHGYETLLYLILKALHLLHSGRAILDIRAIGSRVRRGKVVVRVDRDVAERWRERGFSPPDVPASYWVSLVVAGLDEPLARRGDGRQKFFSCVGARASVSAPRVTACHCTRWSRAHRVGQEEHRRGKRRAPGRPRAAPRPSPRSAQVPIHHPGHVHVQLATAGRLPVGTGGHDSAKIGPKSPRLEAIG